MRWPHLADPGEKHLAYGMAVGDCPHPDADGQMTLKNVSFSEAACGACLALPVAETDSIEQES